MGCGGWPIFALDYNYMPDGIYPQPGPIRNNLTSVGELAPRYRTFSFNGWAGFGLSDKPLFSHFGLIRFVLVISEYWEPEPNNG